MAINASRATAAADQTTAQALAGGHQMVNKANKSMIPDKKSNSPQMSMRIPALAGAWGFQSSTATAATNSKKVTKLADISVVGADVGLNLNCDA